jgi:hypothetical protein
MPSDPDRFDYFISYAHDDDRPPRGESVGWVSVFMEGLESALRKLGLRDGVHPFTDRSTLRGADDLDQQIIDALSRTDLLITLLSPSYFSSKYCMREQEIFVSKNGGEASIIVAELDRPVEDDMSRLSFKNRRGIQFWTKGEGGYTMPMAYPVPQPSDRDFYGRIYELAIEVAESIKAQRKIVAAQPAAAAVPAAVATPARSIVVAEVTEDLDKRREQIAFRLKDAGLPHTLLDSYGLSTEDFISQIDGALGGASHFVQLLGSHAGRARPGAPNGFSRLQYDRAQTLADRTSILQWRDPMFDPRAFDDLQFRDLLEMPTVQAVSFDKFKETMFAGLRAPVAAPVIAPSVAVEPGQMHVFVNYDDRDAKVAETIFNELDENIMAFGPPPADSDEEYHEKVQEELASCDGMMIVYGDSGSKWVHARLAEFSKVIPKRKSALKNLFVLRTPPNDRPLPPVRLPGLKVVDLVEGKSLHDLGVSFS